MSVFRCAVCENYVDSDYTECHEHGSELICDPCKQELDEPTAKPEPGQPGYDPDDVPLFGKREIHIEHCGCDDKINSTRDCGCGFGQCVKELIF